MDQIDANLYRVKEALRKRGVIKEATIPSPSTPPRVWEPPTATTAEMASPMPIIVSSHQKAFQRSSIVKDYNYDNIGDDNPTPPEEHSKLTATITANSQMQSILMKMLNWASSLPRAWRNR